MIADRTPWRLSGQRLSTDFAGRGVFASVGDGNGDLVLTVTLTKKKVNSSGPFGDFTAKYRMAADYALTNSTGVSLASGAVSLDAGATRQRRLAGAAFRRQVRCNGARPGRHWRGFAAA